MPLTFPVATTASGKTGQRYGIKLGETAPKKEPIND